MFSNKFASLISRDPAHARALQLLEAYLETAAAQNRLTKLRLDPRRIQEISDIDSGSELVSLIAVLLSERILKRVVVLESPAGGGIAEYPSLEDVPSEVHDLQRDQWMRVTPGNLRTVYVAEAG
jgi:hypothetical protein